MSQPCHTSEYTFGEEIANGVTHGIGILLALAGLIVMLYFAARYGQRHPLLLGVDLGQIVLQRGRP